MSALLLPANTEPLPTEDKRHSPTKAVLLNMFLEDF